MREYEAAEAAETVGPPRPAKLGESTSQTILRFKRVLGQFNAAPWTIQVGTQTASCNCVCVYACMACIPQRAWHALHNGQHSQPIDTHMLAMTVAALPMLLVGPSHPTLSLVPAMCPLSAAMAVN